MKKNKRLIYLITIISLLLLYQGISIGIHAKNLIQEQYREKIFRLYTWDASVLFLLREYQERPDRREETLVKIIEWAAVAEAVSHDFRYPLLFPNLSPDQHNTPYFNMIQNAKHALLNNETFDVESHIQFLEAKLTYNLHYDAILGINALKGIHLVNLKPGLVHVSSNYFTTIFFKREKLSFNTKQKIYLEDLFYDLELHHYYGNSNLRDY